MSYPVTLGSYLSTSCLISTPDNPRANLGRLIGHAELIEDSIELAQAVLAVIPDLAGVVAIPRSGFFPATTIATTAGVPLYTLNGKDVVPVGHGLRLKSIDNFSGPVLLVDDSSNTGRAMIEAKKIIPRAYGAVVYGTERSREFVDFIAKPMELPHFFAWHLFGSSMIKSMKFGLDFDGVLCRDPYRHEYLHEPSAEYESFLNTAEPHFLPRPHTIPAIITARLEKYRPQTVRWLANHRVNYVNLIMGPWESPQERNRNNVAAWKASELKKLGLHRFIESNRFQAEKISSIGDIFVLCTADVLRSPG